LDIDDLLTDIQLIDANLANKVYLLKDCTSPVVVPGLVDYTQPEDAAFERFAAANAPVNPPNQSTAGLTFLFETTLCSLRLERFVPKKG